MKLTQSCYLTTLVFALSLGCADSRERYSEPPEKNQNGETSPTLGTDQILQSFEEDLLQTAAPEPGKLQSYSQGKLSLLDLFKVKSAPGTMTRGQRDAATRANSQKPAIYGVGAAGIDFRTTLEQANQKLELDVGPTSSGEAWYKEGLLVQWNQNGVRLPNSISLLRDYLGEIPAPEKYRPLHISKEMGMYFSAEDPLGEQVLIDFYNHLENKPEDYNCLEQFQCGAFEYEENIVHLHPGMVFIFGRDNRGSLLQVNVRPVIAPKRLESSFDILHGRFQLSDSQASAAGAKFIPLGISWSEFQKRSGVKHDLYTNYSDGFEHMLNGLAVMASRTQFSRDYQKPNPAKEKFVYVAVYAGFSSWLLLNGAPAWISLNQKTRSVKIHVGKAFEEVGGEAYDYERALQDQPEVVKFPLAIQMPALAGQQDLQYNFMKALTETVHRLKQELAAHIGRHRVYSGVFGEHNPRASREIVGQVYSRKPGEKATRIARFSIEEANGTLHVSHKLSELPFGQLVMENFGLEVELAGSPVGQSLLGFALGSELSLSEHDRGQGEVKLSSSEDSGVVRMEEGILLPFFQIDQGQLSKQNAESDRIEIVEAGVRLYVQEAGEGIAKIVAVDGVPYAKVNGLCGLETFKFQVGDHDLTLRHSLREALKSEEKKCTYKETLSNDSDGRLTTMSFPEQGVVLYFKNRELESMRVHLNGNTGMHLLGGEI